MKEKIKRLNNLSKRITEILAKQDPLKLEAPVSEYSAEAAQITRKLKFAKNVKDVERIIADTFIEYFGADTIGENPDYIAIANEIWKHSNDEFKEIFELK